MTEDLPTTNGEPSTKNGQPSPIEPPPILGTWPRLYGLVLLVLAVDIVVFVLVTRIFS